MPPLCGRCVNLANIDIFSKQIQSVHVVMIARDVFHQTLHEILGDHVICNITKLQCCRRDN